MIRWKNCGGVFDLADKEKRLGALREQASDPDLWSDPEAAQHLMRELSVLGDEVESFERLAQRVADACELAELDGEELYDDLTAEAREVGREIDRLDFQSMFSDPYDREDAILAIHAGAGGTDSQDWAEMMQRMYLRWAETQGYGTEILSYTEGEEAGIKSVMISVAGRYAYGHLRSERGVHRLVRLSPFDAAHRRHTSFALVEVWPDVAGEIDIQVNENDLQIDRFRSAGAGGQNVQKNETAIRITHLPTGMVVTCQNERSQKQNLESALKVLRARLLAIEQQKQQAEMAELKGGYVEAGWGNQIRSYVLHPYQMVKDHRTNLEEGNTAAVLDGRLGGFMEAYLRHAAANGAG
jgi:peptide chain release factor 2